MFEAEAEAEAKILVLSELWPRGLNITAYAAFVALSGDIGVLVYSRFPDSYFPDGFFPGKTFPGWSFSRMRQFLMINLQAHT